jgi:hypothetical protein
MMARGVKPVLDFLKAASTKRKAVRAGRQPGSKEMVVYGSKGSKKSKLGKAAKIGLGTATSVASAAFLPWSIDEAGQQFGFDPFGNAARRRDNARSLVGGEFQDFLQGNVDVAGEESIANMMRDLGGGMGIRGRGSELASSMNMDTLIHEITRGREEELARISKTMQTRSSLEALAMQSSMRIGDY